MNERRHFVAGAELGPRGGSRYEHPENEARFGSVGFEPFVRKLPRETLLLWRTAFGESRLCMPSIAQAGNLLLDELERAYAALERK